VGVGATVGIAVGVGVAVGAAAVGVVPPAVVVLPPVLPQAVSRTNRLNIIAPKRVNLFRGKMVQSFPNIACFFLSHTKSTESIKTLY